MLRGVILSFALMAGAALAQEADQIGTEAGAGEVIENGSAAGLQAWMTGFRGRALAAGISSATFDQVMPGVAFLPNVIERDRKQDEFTKTIWDYLDKAVSEDRIVAGQKALRAHGPLLDQIEARYGVDKHVVLAIWGLESAYGLVRGDIDTPSALATLAYDTRRAAFFEAELIAALQILQSGVVKPAAMVGSWAGAMGHTQFMPSSYLKLAVKFDGPGKPDIWGDDPSDALASAAAYLANAGWKTGERWGDEVRLPAGFDYGLAGDRTQKPLSTWAELGVTRPDATPLPATGWAALLLPAGARGPAFLVYDNFAAIETYNKADSYVIAVGHLADRIAGGAAFKASWPRDLRALTLEERREMQSLLLTAGVYAGTADGKVGPLTVAAVKAFQRKHGLVPDGYPSLEILQALR
ncbi:MAG: lytic murein transglycosylase [Cypionkella sp.]|uniref:lytic murein transglycosylase n=1 Tax=Cypionkella sp. TaxID=2811411 RepID=UPI002ABBB55F|nr:lytic murein transglycosylase [Cypionkella sp.]MDZ4310369.1 lytic murein transglycosylase [Cypionkella sp.]